eukprot:CAMPEP_0201523322 /NCGR_PEP_ID=MMETSP0161_2-20130828/19425_1 /ASSEMBLY_ACC=CAM_ASM_000251 /TAXON_ID=180227 /ORGANISM="Neoparamoeba aestuarina, Strain SoJaBio B1-5/56/2" /LENGTH=307 /DNA_ID=CAMNT_0047922413 /DNA_START=18 /DNA_END=938 /DNA_ORIENTATION=+
MADEDKGHLSCLGDAAEEKGGKGGTKVDGKDGKHASPAEKTDKREKEHKEDKDKGEGEGDCPLLDCSGKGRKRKRISLAEYDEDIRQFLSMRLAPQAIAFQLRQKHCLTEDSCTPAQVSNRIQTLRRKCRIVPTQIGTGASAVTALTCVPTGRGGDDDDELIDDICVTEVRHDENFRNSILEQALTNLGMFFSKETKDSLIVYFNRGHFGCALRLAPLKPNALLVHYDPVQPPPQLFEDTFPRTGLKAVDRPKATMSVMIPSPKPLDIHRKPEIMQWPSDDKAEWVVVILKFEEPQAEKSEIVFGEK